MGHTVLEAATQLSQGCVLLSLLPPLWLESNTNLLQLIPAPVLLLLLPEKFPGYFPAHQEPFSCP